MRLDKRMLWLDLMCGFLNAALYRTREAEDDSDYGSVRMAVRKLTTNKSFGQFRECLPRSARRNMRRKWHE